jgi:hypothetical protein
VGDAPVKGGALALSGEEAPKRKPVSIQRVAADVVESTIKGPKEGREAYYSREGSAMC